MLVVGLVHGSRWEPPEDAPEPPRRRTWHVPWRPLAWLAAWCWLLALVPVADDAFGALAGYAVLLLAVGLGFWRVERWCARQYWQGLREYQA
jgi:apolipoprotein N-acyltransferase